MLKIIIYQILLGFFLVLPVCQIHSQNKVDSLTRLLKSQPINDTTRVNIMNKIAKASYYKNPILTDSITTEAINLSKKAAFLSGEAFALKYKGISHAIRGSYDDARGYYEQSLELFKRANNHKEIAAIQYAIGISYSETGLYEEAKKYYELALQQQKKRRDSIGMADSYIGISGLHKNMSQLDLSLNYIDSAMTLYRELNLELEQSITYNRMANIYIAWADFPKALEKTQQAMVYNEAHNLEQKLSINYHTLGTIYSEIGETDLAMEYYHKSVALKEKLGLEGGMAITIKNIGNLQFMEGNYEKALQSLRTARRLINEVGQPCKEINSILIMGKIFIQLGQTDSAVYYLKHAKEEGQACENLKIVASATLKLAQIEFEKGEVDLAEDHLQEAYKIVRKHGFKTNEMEIARELYKLYKNRNQASKALHYFEQHKQLNDSIFSEQNNLKIARLESQYQLDKEKAIIQEQFKRDKINQQLALEKEVILRNTAIMVAVLFLLLGVATLYFYIRIRKNNKKLNSQNDQITEQNSKLEQLNANRSKLLSLLAHDLRSPLGNMLGIFALIKQKELTETEIDFFSNEIELRVKNLLNFLDNVLNWSKANFSDMPLHKSNLVISDVINEVISMLSETLNHKKIKVDIEDQNHVSSMADQAMLMVIMRNMLSNAIKFSHENSSINIDISQEKDQTRISIQDYGIGMSTGTKDNLFRDILRSSPGTFNEMGAGIGLYLSYDFVKRHGGNVDVISEPEKGTTFIITLPNN